LETRAAEETSTAKGTVATGIAQPDNSKKIEKEENYLGRFSGPVEACGKNDNFFT